MTSNPTVQQATHVQSRPNGQAASNGAHTKPHRSLNDTRHPDHVWEDGTFAYAPLDDLRRDWLEHLRTRQQPTRPQTIKKYDDTLRRFITSLARQIDYDADPPAPYRPILASVHPVTVSGWINEQRRAGLSEHTIVNRLGALKAFTGKYLYRDTGITTVDLLHRVTKVQPPEKPKTGLTEAEREAVVSCFTDPTFVDTRDRAMIAVVMATGLRFREVLELPLSSFDHREGMLVVKGKGGKVRIARLGDRALGLIRPYLSLRPKTNATSDALWLTEWGTPITYEGAHCIIRRARKKSGVDRLHWHLLRHGFAQTALTKGADPLMVQEMLGHSSPTMTRRYLGYVRQQEAARQMPKYSPI